MSEVRLIKEGSEEITGISLFFNSKGPVEHHPEPYILREAAQDAQISDDPEELPEVVVEVEPPPPVVDIEQLEKDAFERGYAEGLETGREEGLKTGEESAAVQIEEMTRRYADSLAQLAAFKDTLRAQVENEVVRLALAVAKKIVHREISIDSTIIHTLVRVALERVSEKSAVVVRLSPHDYEYMTSAHADMSKTEGREIRFESDNSLAQGDCMIQTETGDIDARIEEEFSEVESAFFEGL